MRTQASRRLSDRRRYRSVREHRQRAQHMHAITKLSQEAQQLAASDTIIHYPAFGATPYDRAPDERAPADNTPADNAPDGHPPQEAELAEIRHAVHEAQWRGAPLSETAPPSADGSEAARDRIQALIAAEVKAALEEMAPQIVSQTLITLLSQKTDKPRSDDG